MSNIYNTNLSWNESKGDTDHEDHEQLSQPDVRRNVTVTDCGECHYGEVERLKQGQGLLRAGSLDVLDAADSVSIQRFNQSLYPENSSNGMIAIDKSLKLLVPSYRVRFQWLNNALESCKCSKGK